MSDQEEKTVTIAEHPMLKHPVVVLSVTWGWDYDSLKFNKKAAKKRAKDLIPKLQKALEEREGFKREGCLIDFWLD